MVCGAKAANDGFKRTECAGMVQNEQNFHMSCGLSWRKNKKRGRVMPGPTTTFEKNFKQRTV
jgi:hypothetical protein